MICCSRSSCCQSTLRPPQSVDLSEDEDARETARLVEDAWRSAVLVRGNLRNPDRCRWRKTSETNVNPMFYLVKAAFPHMKQGSSVIATTSINADQPSPSLLPYAVTKGTIRDFVAGLGQMLAKKGVRVNGVAPGPVWTPLIPSTMPPKAVENFGKNTPIGRSAQPRELAPPYVMLASDEASYIIGATIPVTGGRPFI